jgi:hypothetical protein
VTVGNRRADPKRIDLIGIEFGTSSSTRFFG